jgi:large subunit ribosomal protein L1
MRNVAKVMARFLGQRGKMPKPQPKGFGVITTNENLDDYVERLQHVVKLDMKKQLLLQVKVGRKSQNDSDILENIDSLLIFLGSKLPNSTNNIKSMYIKTTMGPAIKVQEGAKK